jgi:hypothetical protein
VHESTKPVPLKCTAERRSLSGPILAEEDKQAIEAKPRKIASEGNNNQRKEKDVVYHRWNLAGAMAFRFYDASGWWIDSHPTSHRSRGISLQFDQRPALCNLAFEALGEWLSAWIIPGTEALTCN